MTSTADQQKKDMNSTVQQCREAVREAITISSTHRRSFEDAESYNKTLQHTFTRTVQDVVRCVPVGSRVLEIGAFTGVVSIAMKRLGYDVCASDIGFVMNDPATHAMFKEQNIQTLSHELSESPFPSADESFDAIIFCEVLEHLNFNPLPLIQEFHRILRDDGVVYCATPNLASLKNRSWLLRGKGFYNPIEHLEWNLKPETGMSVGLHWREYTKEEMVKLFESRGLNLMAHTFCNYAPPSRRSTLRKRVVGGLYYLFPSLMHGQTAVFQKTPVRSSEPT